MNYAMSVIIIGVGNRMLTDDGVGPRVVEQLRSRLSGRPGVAMLECNTGGISLMEAMCGYQKGIIVDAIVTGQARPGTVYSLAPSDLLQSKNVHSTHDANLTVALELGRLGGLSVPAQVKILAIEAQDVATFGEALTEEVERAVPAAVGQVLQELQQTQCLLGDES